MPLILDSNDSTHPEARSYHSVMDGFSFLQRLHEDYPGLNVPIIVKSAVDDIDSITKALQLGCIEYFTKPLNTDVMNIILPRDTTIRNILTEAEKYYTEYKLFKDDIALFIFERNQ